MHHTFARHARVRIPTCRRYLFSCHERIATPAVRHSKFLPLARGCALSFALRPRRAMSRRQLSTGAILQKSVSRPNSCGGAARQAAAARQIREMALALIARPLLDEAL